MTVKELIAALQAEDPDAEVWTEGCDCVGDVVSVERFESDGKKIVQLNRS